ncbi:MAG: glycosyltransferase family 4 protein [Nitrospirae bacterium]|nr:glycosyltransferase family 4 protein [Nitrospirota bacterium]
METGGGGWLVRFLKTRRSPSIVQALGHGVFLLMQLKGRLLDRFFQGKRLAETEKVFLDGIAQCVRKAEDSIGRNRYKCFIGAEPGGLAAAATIGQKMSVPVVYYNLELHLVAESRTIMEKVVKSCEKKFNKNAAFTITLDEERAESLARDNEISISDILTVPVCADGPRFEEKTDWLRKKFNLSAQDRILLYAGFITEWAMCEELAKTAMTWPDNRVLVLHSHGYHNPRFIEKLRKYEGKKVKISREPVAYDDLPSLLASADIGIALYRDIGKNFTLVSSASGKLSHYLKSGLPVITNDYPGMTKVIEKYGCGRCVDRVEKISEAMEMIFNNYDLMRGNAYTCYEENYLFSKQFTPVIERIKKL